MAWTRMLTLHEDMGSSECSDTLWDGTSPLVLLPAASQLGASEALRSVQDQGEFVLQLLL